MSPHRPPGPASPLDAARRQLQQSNARFLDEIGQLAGQLQQKSTSPEVRQWAAQMLGFCDQIRANEQMKRQL